MVPWLLMLEALATTGPIAWSEAIRVDDEHLSARQHHATSAIDDRGHVAVVWDQTGDDNSIRAKIFGPMMEPLTAAMWLAECPSSQPCRPDVVSVGDTFWIAWSDPLGIYLNSISAEHGEGDIILVARPAEGHSIMAPALAANARGGVTVSWTDNLGPMGGTTTQYYRRSFRPDGSPVTEALPLGRETPYGGTLDITAMDSGHILAAHSSYQEDALGRTARIEGTVFAPGGEERGTWTLVEMRDVLLTRPMVAAREGRVALTFQRETLRTTLVDSFFVMLDELDPVIGPHSLGLRTAHPIAEFVGDTLVLDWDMYRGPADLDTIWETQLGPGGAVLVEPDWVAGATPGAERTSLAYHETERGPVAVRTWTGTPLGGYRPKLFIQRTLPD